MAKPNSRATLITYCKRALGHPVIEINVDDDQVDDRIDEAFQFYNEYHSDAVEKVFLKHLVTASYLTLTTSVAGNFNVGETITGGTSGAKAYVVRIDGSKIYYTQNSKTGYGTFANNEAINGGTSGQSVSSKTSNAVVSGEVNRGSGEILFIENRNPINRTATQIADIKVIIEF